MTVLDTHVLVWAMQADDRLGPQARRLIEDAASKTALFVPAITPWEIAMLVEKGRLALGRDVGQWLEAALGLSGIRLSPLSVGISVDSVRLPGQFHPDPADRMIVATARALDATLLTADRAILTYGEQGYVRVTDARL